MVIQTWTQEGDLAMATGSNSYNGPKRAPVSRANQIAAAQLFIAASKKSGVPVPDWIKAIAREGSS